MVHMSTAQDERTIPALTLGWRLRMAQEYAGLKRPYLAQQLEVDDSTITRWTHDKVRPSRSHILHWARLCNVNEEWLEHGTGEPIRPEPGQPAPKPAALAELTARKRGRSRSAEPTDRYLRKVA